MFPEQRQEGPVEAAPPGPRLVIIITIIIITSIIILANANMIVNMNVVIVIVFEQG